jgi:hypothetical protein
MARSYPPLRDGEAYTSSSKEEFDNAVKIVFDYGDLTVKAEMANKIADKYLRAINKDFAKALNDKSLQGLIKPTVKSGSYTQVLLFPADFKQQVAADLNAAGKIFAEEMKGEIKQVIATTAGRRGPGRIDTSRMFDFVFGRRTFWDKEKGVMEVSAGWLDTWYKYFGFQEEGTYQIKPMNAISHTAMLAFSQASKFARMYAARIGSRKGFKGFR